MYEHCNLQFHMSKLTIFIFYSVQFYFFIFYFAEDIGNYMVNCKNLSYFICIFIVTFDTLSC
jgi:hypothetical protein